MAVRAMARIIAAFISRRLALGFDPHQTRGEGAGEFCHVAEEGCGARVG